MNYKSINKPTLISFSIMTCWSVTVICYSMLIVYHKLFGDYWLSSAVVGFYATINAFGFLFGFIALLLAYWGISYKKNKHALLAVFFSLLVLFINGNLVSVNVTA